MMNRRTFLQLTAVAGAGAAPAAPLRTVRQDLPAAAAGSRAGEVLALRKFVEQTSPRGLEASADPAWRRDWEAMHTHAAELGDGPYVIGLRRLLTWFKEGHTTIVPFEFLGAVPAPLATGVWGYKFPIKAVPCYDGLWVREASGDAGSLLGARIRSIGGHAIEQIMASYARSWPAENPAWAHNWAAHVASSLGALQGLGVAAGPATAPLEFHGVFADGREASARLTAHIDDGGNRTIVDHADTLVAKLKAKAGVGNFAEVLADGKTLYVSIDDMADVEGLSFGKFTDAVLSRAKPEEIRRVVIDLRRNGGGDNYLAEPLRHELGRSRFNRPGGICVLIGPATFSAAQNFANRIERECFATYIGEPTGSAPNLVGDSAFFVGKATGITAMVARLRWFDGGPDDKRRWIFPDVFVPSLFADWVAGRDPALDAALTVVPEGEDAFASRVRYFERGSQKGLWHPFWNPA